MSRRAAREVALKTLFQVDVGKMAPGDALASANSEQRLAPESAGYCRGLVDGTLANLAEIDAHLGKHAREWKIGRMANVDRNILRLAAYELLHRRDIPAAVAINEAVELAKKFSTAESGGFINGVLASLAREIEGVHDER